VLTGKDHDHRHPDHANQLKERIHRLGLEKNIRHLGVLPRDQQIQLLRRACAVVQPSLFEGWSMLVEDCRALGKKIILSDLAVHLEQNYESAQYFTSDNCDSLTKVLGESWPHLQPGPDPDAESSARIENERLLLENGYHLLDIFNKAMGKS
jgi:glycosyltransferase involved in cell wall biosynthesis